jgi:hypothetical protein
MKTLKIALPFIFSAVSATQSVYAGVESWEFGIDRPGSDIREFVQPTNDPRLCENLCLGTLECIAWTLTLTDNTCRLKSSAPDPVVSTSTVSGVVPKFVIPAEDQPGP